MLDTIRSFVDRHMGAAGRAVREDDERALQLAVATLLMEVARADHRVSERERGTVRKILEEHFDLSAEEMHDLAAVAEHEAEHATSLYPLTRQINDECSAQDKVQLLRRLWQVTCADGRIDPHEEHLVRKIADLLHVPHREFIRAKLEVSADD